MKKFLYYFLSAFMGVVVAYPIAVFAQDSLNLTLPTSFDFTSSPVISLNTSNMVVSTIIALVVGYLSPYLPFISKIDKTAFRVAAAIIPALIVVSIFGFKGDALNVFMSVVWGLFSANTAHSSTIKPIGEALELPFFLPPTEESVTDEEAEATEAMIKRQKKSKLDL